MFKNTYQSGLLSIFYSCGANPLSLWDTNVQNGHIKRLTDNEINSLVLELVSTNVSTTYIKCPRKNAVLGIKLPFLVVILKNLKRYFSFEIVILDNTNFRRRFKVSNFQSTTKVKPFCTSMPVDLSEGWNQIQFNLADFTHRAYGTQYIEALQVEVHANTRLRRIYFSDRLYSEDELPQDYKLFLPIPEKEKKEIREVKKVKGCKLDKVKVVPSSTSVQEKLAKSVPEQSEEPVRQENTETPTEAKIAETEKAEIDEGEIQDDTEDRQAKPVDGDEEATPEPARADVQEALEVLEETEDEEKTEAVTTSVTASVTSSLTKTPAEEAADAI